MHAVTYCPPLPDLKRIEPACHVDERGHFFETFRQRDFDTAVGQRVVFVQDNQSYSRRGVLRGLHSQRAPHAQGKLVRVVHGEVFDVAADVRRDSPTFGRWAALRLSAENRWQHWIPAGYAHGFLVLSDAACVLYKTTDYWFPDYEVTLAWDDPTLAIAWPLSATPLLSDKDRAGVCLAQITGNCFARADVGDVGHPNLVGSIGTELALQHIGSHHTRARCRATPVTGV